jgi:fucokinase
MRLAPEPWDYLVLTASNDRQAEAYESQLRIRREAGRLSQVRHTIVLPDLEGKRIGSGGSTLLCLAEIVSREQAAPEEVLRRRRVLIVHAGGDSRRLPAYGPCGKIFIPLPGDDESAFGTALFDKLIPPFLALPASPAGVGQVLVAAGDALIRFDPQTVSFGKPGLTTVGCAASPAEAARHGVFCAAKDGRVRRYLQKPSVKEQHASGAIDSSGHAVLDAGIMSFDGAAAAALLRALPIDSTRELLLNHGIDLYREICCALGTEATLEHFIATARASGSTWSSADLAALYPALRSIPFHLELLPELSFLHFGSTRQLIESGIALSGSTLLSVGNDIHASGSICGDYSWVEGCGIAAPLTLGGRNVVTGVDVTAPLTLPSGACLDVLAGAGATQFVRCYGVDDDFKRPASRGATFCGVPLQEWLGLADISPESIWDSPHDRSLWNARLFPTGDFHEWLWMFDIATATQAQKDAWRGATRYSAESIALAADQDAFHRRRAGIRSAAIERSPNALLRAASHFSARDLSFALAHSSRPTEFAAALSARARALVAEPTLQSLAACRILHSLGSALDESANGAGTHLRDEAFRHLHETILRATLEPQAQPRSALRPDEAVWGRAPARIELGGGWTDTPPYTLEHGGDVANVAVNLNGQPPIHSFGRVVEEPVIRLASIDGGARLEITSMRELLDYRRPDDRFALAKAALAISGFGSETASLSDVLQRFGGGIELTTLVGIPKGSGLGTSSILGTVILGVIERMLGRPTNQRALFHDVLRLEQALTTGGGWQDQVGGGVGGAKITSTRPGLIPDPSVQPLPDDLIDPRRNGGSTLLYYTGLTRLAKNILEQVVGGYLNRDADIMSALAEEHLVAREVAAALNAGDAAAFGSAVNYAWELQKRLCGTVTNDTIERLLELVRPHVYGMRISGAGSGGFLLMICKSPGDAACIRSILEVNPLNDRSRFFDFEVNHTGLEVTTC